MGAFDEFIGGRTVAALREELAAADPTRDWPALDRVGESLHGHALKARSDLVSRALDADLGGRYRAAAAAYRAALASEGFRGWTIWPVTESVVRNDGPEAARAVVDDVVHYRKANGSASPKVFTLTTATLGPREARRFSRTHAFRPLTTRVHHGGTHSLQVQVNGRRSAEVPFELVVP